MIIEMRRSSTEKDILQVLTFLRDCGWQGTVHPGLQRLLISMAPYIDRDRTLPLTDEQKAHAFQELEHLPGVVRVVSASKPYPLVSREVHPEPTLIPVAAACVQGGIVHIGGPEAVMMAGPCTVENEKQLMQAAAEVRQAGAVILRGGAFKPSTSPYGFRGLGEKGLKLLAKARAEFGMAVITEVMTPEDIPLVSDYADILQIGARNMQNFFLLDAVGRCEKPVMVKRGMSATIEEWMFAVEYVLLQGNSNVMLCERGIRTFEKMTRNTMDISAIPLARMLSHLPVIADPSQGTGRRDLVIPLALAALVSGADGLLIEVHPHPEKALKDGAQSLTPEQFRDLMAQARAVASAVKRPVIAPGSLVRA